jgi:hypothetical protein
VAITAMRMKTSPPVNRLCTAVVRGCDGLMRIKSVAARGFIPLPSKFICNYIGVPPYSSAMLTSDSVSVTSMPGLVRRKLMRADGSVDENTPSI